MESITEFCLIRTQNKALNHRLMQLEEEFALKEEEHALVMERVHEERDAEIKSLKEKFEEEIETAISTAKHEVEASALFVIVAYWLLVSSCLDKAKSTLSIRSRKCKI